MTPTGDFSTRLRTAMDLRGLSQAGLGRAISSSQSVVQRYVSGEAVPAGEQMMRLPQALGISGHWLLTGEGPMEPPGADVIAIYERGRERGWAEAVETLRGAQASIRATSGAAVPEEAIQQAEEAIRAAADSPDRRRAPDRRA